MQNISIKDVQNKILDITIKFNDFCYKHNINYCLMGGSALGCARHNGFIPWDDDLDVFMKYDDYEKFKIAIKNDPIPNLYFQKGNTEELPLFISKLRMNNTTFIERESSQRNMHKGIYIDIMVLNKAPNFFVSRFFQFQCYTFSFLIAFSRRNTLIIDISVAFVSANVKPRLFKRHDSLAQPHSKHGRNTVRCLARLHFPHRLQAQTFFYIVGGIIIDGIECCRSITVIRLIPVVGYISKHTARIHFQRGVHKHHSA